MLAELSRLQTLKKVVHVIGDSHQQVHKVMVVDWNMKMDIGTYIVNVTLVVKIITLVKLG